MAGVHLVVPIDELAQHTPQRAYRYAEYITVSALRRTLRSMRDSRHVLSCAPTSTEPRAVSACSKLELALLCIRLLGRKQVKFSESFPVLQH